MKSYATILLAALTLVAGAGTLPITVVSTHNNKDNFGGNKQDMINGSGMNGVAYPNDQVSWPPATDPATWTTTGTSYRDEWQSGDLLAGAENPTNGKIGWVIVDLGSSQAGLDKFHIWHIRENPARYAKNFNVYLAETPTVAIPASPTGNSSVDYDFSSGGWTGIATGLVGTHQGKQVVNLGGATARYIGIEIITNNGDAARVGFAEFGVTQTTADTDPPTLSPSAIVDNKSGGPVDVSTLVTYTLNFSEDINSGTVTALDFDNAGTSAITIGAIQETSPGVFTVQVTPTTVGTLQLRIPVSASITDVAGNPLDNDPAIVDDTTITVNADGTPPTLAPANIVDDRNGGPIAMSSIVIYTVTFSEDINSSTVSSSDFGNAGTSNINIGTIAETFPGVFTIEVTPTDEGTLRLQIPAGAAINDTAGNPLANGTAILDDTTITVQSGAPSALVGIAAITGSHGGDQYANGMVSLTNGSGINKANPNDPATWTFSGSGYQEEWMATYLKVGNEITPGLNGKVAWACLDFGSKTPLGMLYLFNTNYSSGVSGTDQFNLYYADSPAASLPAQPAKNAYSSTGLTPPGDYNFAGGGWTLFNTSGPLNANLAGVTSLNLPGVSARYLAIEILSNQGDSTGGGRVGFDEIAVTVAPPDQDGDKLPDAYELANTVPSDATALDPTIDYEPDGLTTWQEYVLGTDPNDADTDDDTLNDGPETVGVGSRPPTNPLLADTDGDGIGDLAESNTGVWGGTADPGTDPTKADTDEDGLRDNVETNTGIYVSTSDTGTSPLNPNSDGDNAGDWYEVAIIDMNPALYNPSATPPAYPPNSPNSPSLMPNIPYPLTAERGVPAASNAPVKVFIMSGQSNMVGFGQIAGTKPGTLQTITGAENKFPNLVAAGGAWSTRNDVYYRGVISDTGDGPLRADVAGDKIGPELGFGQVMGWYFGEPVLLIKSSIGNRSLMWDFAAPTTPSFDYAVDGRTYAGYGQAPNSWLTATGTPYPFIWYAGKQFDDCFKKESDMSQLTWQVGTAYQASGNIGSQVRHNGKEYQCTVSHTASAATEPGVAGNDWATVWKLFTVDNAADVLDNFATHYAGDGQPFAGRDFEIAGYVWWQGYGDQGEPAATNYRENMARFIRQIRSYYENRYNNDTNGEGESDTRTNTRTNAPFVLATFAADGGWNNPGAGAAKVAQAQIDVAGDVPNVKTVEARGFWRDSSVSPKAEGFHYNWNAETYMLAGDALGRAMVDLQLTVTPPGSAFEDWADGPFASVLTDTDPSLDFDGGSLPTGIEWVVGGDPTSGGDDAGLAPTIDTTTDRNGKLLFTFRRATSAKNDANTSIAVQYGSSLAGWNNAVHEGSAANQVTIAEAPGGTGFDIVTVALPPGLAANGKLFVRLNVAVAVE